MNPFIISIHFISLITLLIIFSACSNAVQDLQDYDSPVIVEFIPRHNDTGVPIDSQLVIKFDEAINVASLNENTVIIKDSEDRSLSRNLDYQTSEYSIVLTPETLFSYNSTYTVQLSSEIQDRHNNGLDTDEQITFTTELRPIWSQNFQDTIVAVEVNNKGETIAAGNKTLMKLDAFGEIIWSKNYGADIFLTDMKILDDETIIGAGNSANDISLVKFDDNGSIIWKRKYNSQEYNSFPSLALAVANDDSLILAGATTSLNVDEYEYGLVIKTDSFGDIVWQNRYGWNWPQYFFNVGVSNDNSIYAIGYRYHPDTDYEPWIVRINENGTIAWQKIYSGSPTIFDSIVPYGDKMLVGGSSTIMLLNGDGNPSWKYSYSNNGRISALDINSNGNIIASGNFLYANGAGSFILNLDSNGGLIKYKSYAYNTNRSTSLFKKISSFTDGGVVTTGSFSSNNSLISSLNFENDIEFNPASGLLGYNIENSKTNVDLIISNVNDLAYVVNSVSVNTNVVQDDITYDSELLSGPTTFLDIPELVSAAQNGSRQILINWQDNSNNELGYIVHRSTDNITFLRIATVDKNTIEFNDTALTSGTTYYYKIAAYNSNGYSKFSNIRIASAL